MTDMLPYEEELRLGDIIAAGRDNPDDKKLQEEAKKAIWKIVEAYTPMIRSDVKQAIGPTSNRYLAVDVEDVVTETQLDATKLAAAFNPRGNGERPGRRFSGYARLALRRTIMSVIARAGTPLQAPTTVLRREMTDYAIADGAGGVKGGYIPGYHDTIELSDIESSVADNRVENIFNNHWINDSFITACERVFRKDIASVIKTIAMYGSTLEQRDIAKEAGVSETFINRFLRMSHEIFSHPSTRARLIREIHRVENEKSAE